MTTLAAELAAFLADFNERMPPDVLGAMRAADAAIAATGIEADVLAPGSIAPDFVLPDADGRTVSLNAALANGPVILTFYRGRWCPYCNLELRAYQRVLPEIAAAGARVIAVSPQTPDATRDTADANGLGFEVLSDVGSHVAERYGLAFALPQPLRALYTRFGHPLPAVNGTHDWRLPLPGTFVIGTDGRVLLARASVDYRTRLEPADALAALALQPAV